MAEPKEKGSEKEITRAQRIEQDDRGGASAEVRNNETARGLTDDEKFMRGEMTPEEADKYLNG